MSALLLKPLYRKLNQVIFQSNFKDCMLNGWCRLCEHEEPWVVHKVNFKHRQELRHLVQRLMNELLPLGIVLRTEAENDDKLTNGLIHCVLCEKNVGKKFDSDFHNHVASLEHMSQVIKQESRQERFHQLDKYLEAIATFIGDNEEAALIKGVSGAGMTIDIDGSLTCAICGDFKIMDQVQFGIHVNDSVHLTEVNEQLIKMVYAHIDQPPNSSSGAANHHDENVSAHFQDYDTYDAKSMNDLSADDYDRESLLSSSDESLTTTPDFCYPNDDGVISDDDDNYLGGYDGFGV